MTFGDELRECVNNYKGNIYVELKEKYKTDIEIYAREMKALAEKGYTGYTTDKIISSREVGEYVYCISRWCEENNIECGYSEKYSTHSREIDQWRYLKIIQLEFRWNKKTGED